ncbi:hypothetical protein ACHQM5_026080 [Ranunculus cassubicifolius]
MLSLRVRCRYSNSSTISKDCNYYEDSVAREGHSVLCLMLVSSAPQLETVSLVLLRVLLMVVLISHKATRGLLGSRRKSSS